jgi:hypothetical protein
MASRGTKLAEIFFQFGDGGGEGLTASVGALHAEKEECTGDKEADAETAQHENPAFPVQYKDKPDQQQYADAKTEKCSDAENERTHKPQALDFELVASQLDTRTCRSNQRRRSVAQGSEEAAGLPGTRSGAHADCLTATDENAERQAKRGSDANGLPGVFMHEIVGSAGRCLGFVDECGFGILQANLGVTQAILNAGTQFNGLFTSLAGSYTQNLLGIGNDDLHVGDQFVLGSIREIGVISHDDSSFQYFNPGLTAYRVRLE